jgi:hypothetical protein
VVDVHWWSKFFTLRAGSLFQNSLTLFLGEAWEACERSVRPILNLGNMLYPDWRPLSQTVSQFARSFRGV